MIPQYNIGALPGSGKAHMPYVMCFARRLLVVFAVVWAGFRGHVSAQHDAYSDGVYISDEFVFDRWTIEDGLPVNSVVQIFQSSDGYLWLVTYDGIVRFDGIRFTVFNTDTHPELPGNRFTSMHETPNGTLWFETELPNFLLSFRENRFRVWRPDDGLAGSRALDVHSGPDGTLWVGTESGISTYRDGVMKPFRPDRIRGRADRIFADSGSTLFLVLDDRISRFAGDSLYTILDEPQSRQPPYYEPFLSLGDGRVLFGADAGLYVYDSSSDGCFCRLTNPPPDSDEESSPATSDEKDSSASRGSSVVKSAADRESAADGLYLLHPVAGADDKINSIHKTGDGAILFSNYQTGFYRWDPNREPLVKPVLIQRYDDGMEGTVNSKLYTTAGPDLWKVTRRQLFRNRTLILQLSDNITGYLHDREGNIWVATYSSGLIRLKPNPFQTYSIPEGLTDRNVYPVLETQNGDILTGSMSGGVHKMDAGGSVSNFATPSQVRAIHQLHDGTILVGKARPTILEFSKGTFTPWKPDSTHIPVSINAIHEDEDRNVWAGSRSGLFLYSDQDKGPFADNETTFPPIKGGQRGVSQGLASGSGWRNLTEELDLPDAPVRYFAPAPDGILWMATAGNGVFGLQKIELSLRGETNNHASAFNNDEHPPQSPFSKGEYSLHRLDLPADFVRSIYVDTQPSDRSHRRQGFGGQVERSDGYYLWIGTEGRGLFRVRWDPDLQEAVHITQIQKRDGLPDNTIHQILEDGAGNFWMSTNSGLFKAGIEELHEWCDGRRDDLQLTIFTESDGMRNREANGGVQPAGIRASDGRLWFPTQDGLAVIDPGNAAGKNEHPPLVKIEHLIADTLQRVFPDQVQLRARQRNFEIHYAGLHYRAPEKVTFSYKLEGFDENWIDAGTRRTAYYTNVPPASYRFRVRAFNNDGLESEKPALATIHIAPYFYETLWFRLMMILAVISFVAGGVWLRIRKMKKDERVLRETVDQRTAELRDAMLQLEDQAQQLAELDKAKSRFFANMSHEFRTPLTLILGPLEELLRTNHTKRIHHQLFLMKRNGYRLKRLVDQVLDLVKLESDNLELDMQEIEVRKFVSEVVELFRPLAERQGLELKFAGQLKDVFIFADRDKAEHILGNLLSNAIKFTDEGGRVEVSLAGTPDRAIITVTDTGRGIPEEEQEHIFDRFYQVDDGDDRPAEGMGIGLALCREFMELHQGTISVESEPGKGSTFTLEFLKSAGPFRAQVPRAQAGRLRQQKSAGSRTQRLRQPKSSVISRMDDEFSGNGRKLAAGESTQPPKRRGQPTTAYRDHTTLLVIDDHEDMRDYLKSVLMDEYKILEASNGEEALTIVQKNPPDLIIADIMMPVMDGLAFSSRLRETPLCRNIPIVFLTARSGDDDQIEALQHGGNDYLSKPFNPEVLLARVAALLASQQRLREQLLVEAAASGEHAPVQTDGPRGDNWLANVVRHIEKNLHDPGFGVEQLAGLMHTDQSQLYRKVKKVTGRPPVQLLKEARLMKAQKLIEAGKTNYSEIAYACGFNSLSYFSRSYKTFFGHAPSSQPGDAEKQT